MAYQFPRSELGDEALFPHILTRSAFPPSSCPEKEQATFIPQPGSCSIELINLDPDPYSEYRSESLFRKQIRIQVLKLHLNFEKIGY
jgi:hypothetical protein